MSNPEGQRRLLFEDVFAVGFMPQTPTPIIWPIPPACAMLQLMKRCLVPSLKSIHTLFQVIYSMRSKIFTTTKWCLALFTGIVLFTSSVRAMPALVDAVWLMQHQTAADLKIIDVQPAAVFRQYHIAGSVSAPFSQWRTNDRAEPPKSLPPAAEVQALIRRLGISAEDRIVLVGTGRSVADLSAAARVYWTLRWAGLSQIAILDGGLVSYVNEHMGSYESGKVGLPEPSDYVVKPDASILALKEDIQTTQQPLLDARSQQEFLGLMTAPGEQAGTLAGAKNLSYDLLSENASGKMLDSKKLQSLFNFAGLKSGQGALHFCHTGNRAALSWYVDYALLGNRDARLYDGSMIEWASDPANPVVNLLQ